MNTSANNSNKDQLPIPRGYEYQKVLAEGNNTQVIKCVKPRTRETMVVKIGKNGNDLSHEVKVLGDLREHDMTRFNIVDFLGTVIINGKTGLKFETLDIGLLDYIRKEGGQMHLEDIRKVIEQLAFALYGLKTQGMIHTDVKPDNIMLTNRNRIPLRVKLIDFGKAIYKSDVKPDTDAEPVYNRFLSAPENLLGLPFSEAIDMWSLGCVLGIMLTGRTLFPDTNSHDTLRSMIDLLGPPPKHLIDAGLRSKMFFEKSISDEWILKEHPGSADDSPDDPPDTFHSLETLKAMRLEKNNDKEADQRGACIDLLKEMLRWDGRLRISPNAISNHPFLTRRYHESNLPLRSCISLPAGIVMVQPAAPENSTQLEKTSDLDSEKCVSPPSGVIMVQPAAPKKSIDLDRKKCVSPPSGVIMVQPAAPENDIDLDEESDDDSETSSSSSSNSDLDEIPDLDNERISSPPSGVIMVQPAAPENDIVLDEIPDLHNERIFSLPGGISMVVSSAPKSRTHLDEESDEDSDASSSSSSGSDLDEDSDEDGETIFSPPSGVIANQPAAPVINIDLEEIPDRDNERIFSLPGGISMVVSSAPKNRTHLDEESDEDSDASSSSSSGSDLDEDSDEDGETISSSSSGSDLDEDSDEDGETIFSPPSGVIANQPAAPVINIDLEEIPDRDNERIVSLPSGVVMVQPAASEDNIDLDEESDEDSDTSSSSSSGSDLDEDSDEDGETIFSPPSGVIANQPAAPVINIDLEEIPDRDNERIYSLPGGISMVVSSAPKSRTHLDEESDEDSDTSSSSSSGSDLDEDCDEDGETIFSPPSGVIANQPTAPVINIDLEEIPDRDNERIYSLPGGISMVVSSGPKNRRHLEKTSDEDGETMIHPDNEDLSPDTSDKKKKKKNGFKRFLSWMKKAICPCCNVKNVQD
ncbi:putative dual specificity tyrosine-phosphorylation-regulated kinase 3 homolog isoform X8 [Sebastes umbrosus]|uniref:putative dual specificity tyrosine-phosphorylation-regulated kinase 3 homolog isoform X8 n=1 Tax=Sebastes umbrosus TaxID=72105 RepID=UPI00189D6616|nr:putative dual specificity tyrosine-phosphorylation-regulated kinase 3 homolog isoform X8 [Sebastes umbrosus]